MSLKEDINDMKKEVSEVKEIKKQSLARETLEDYKKQNKRLFIILIIVLVMWFATGCYLVYILNDIGTIEETSTQEISDIAQYEGTLLDKRDFVRGYLDRTYKRLSGVYGLVGEVSAVYPNNILLITMNGHIVCSKNGIIYDTFDCRDRQVENVLLVN